MGSPGRFNLDDLGLNLDNEEDNDFCRGYGANTNLYEDAYFGPGNNEMDMADDEEGDNDHVPEMPTDFYKNVDSFLSRPPPSLKGSSAPKKSKNDKEKESNSKVPMFPSINAKQQDNRMYLPPPPVAVENEGIPKKKKTKSKESKGASESASRRPLDNALLNEAFAYTDKLLREAVLEEQKEQQQQLMQMNTKPNVNSNRANSTGTIGVEYGKPQQKSDSSSNVNVLRKLKSDRQKGYLASGTGGSTSGKTSSNAASSGGRQADFNVASGEGDFVDSRRNIVDFDELVANFESGATLQKLRKELEDSKRSMANSQNYLRNMTKDLYK